MKYIFSLLLWLAVFSVTAQQSTKLDLHQGQTIVKNTEVQSITTMEAYGQKFEYEVNANMKTLFHVVRIETNRIYIDITIDSMQSELSSNGVKMKFNSQEPVTDSNNVFAQPLLDIVGKSYAIVLDSNGLIVQTDTSTWEKKAKDYMAGLVLTGNNLEIGSRFELFQDLPDDTIITGRTWLDSTRRDDGVVNNQYKVLSSLGNNLKVAINGNVAQKVTAIRDGIDTQSQLQGIVEGTLECNKNSGWISKRQMQILMHGNMSLQGTSFPTRSQTTILESVK